MSRSLHHTQPHGEQRHGAAKPWRLGRQCIALILLCLTLAATTLALAPSAEAQEDPKYVTPFFAFECTQFGADGVYAGWNSSRDDRPIFVCWTSGFEPVKHPARCLFNAIWLEDQGLCALRTVTPPVCLAPLIVHDDKCWNPLFTDTPWNMPFNDVADERYYTVPVEWAARHNVTNGTSPTTFTPEGIVTRAQMARFLWNYAGQPDPVGPSPFVDVPGGTYYTDAVAWMAEQGITTGTTPTTFSPGAAVTRAQIATFIHRFSEQPGVTPNFSDVPAGAYYEGAVGWMEDNGITTGTSPTTFSPNALATRGQVVTFLYRYAGVTDGPALTADLAATPDLAQVFDPDGILANQ